MLFTSEQFAVAISPIDSPHLWSLHNSDATLHFVLTLYFLSSFHVGICLTLDWMSMNRFWLSVTTLFVCFPRNLIDSQVISGFNLVIEVHCCFWITRFYLNFAYLLLLFLCFQSHSWMVYKIETVQGSSDCYV